MTRVYLAHGSHNGDICACITALAMPPPERSWYEPRPGSGLDERGAEIPALAPATLHPLLKDGTLEPPEGVAIDEARLFWPWGSLYLVEEGDGVTRWSFWARLDQGEEAIADAERAIAATGAMPDSGALLEHGTVLPLQDHARFFGAGEGDGADGEALGLCLLRRDGAVIGWTVTRSNGGGS